MIGFFRSFAQRGTTTTHHTNLSEFTDHTLRHLHHAAVRTFCINVASIFFTIGLLAGTLGASLPSAILSILSSAHQIWTSRRQMQAIEKLLKSRGIAVPRWRKRDIVGACMLGIAKGALDLIMPGLLSFILDAVLAALDVSALVEALLYDTVTLLEYILEIYDAVNSSSDNLDDNSSRHSAPFVDAPLGREIWPFTDT